MAYEKTKEAIDNLPGELQEIASDYLKDIEYWEAKIDQLQKLDIFETRQTTRDGKTITIARKTPVHDMLKEAQQQKVNLQRALSVLFKNGIDSEEDDDGFMEFVNKRKKNEDS